MTSLCIASIVPDGEDVSHRFRLVDGGTVRIFYSWQSDSPNATNRGLILQALQAAAQAVGKDHAIDVEPVVDRDTTGVAGSPDIAATIFEKIAKSEAVVCDVSIVGTAGHRPVPNPNVLVELGYAVGVLGRERVIVVANTALGSVESLPFDLRSRRVLAYTAAASDGERASVRRDLQRRLQDAVVGIAQLPRRDLERRLAAPYPDVRVKTTLSFVPIPAPGSTFVDVTVQNHSPMTFFPGNVEFERSDRQHVFFPRDGLTHEFQRQWRLEPGDSFTVHFDPTELGDASAGHVLLRAYVTDKIGRRFEGDADELQLALAATMPSPARAG